MIIWLLILLMTWISIERRLGRDPNDSQMLKLSRIVLLVTSCVVLILVALGK
jgi:hypothetical protein